jgi:hypothetical protein
MGADFGRLFFDKHAASPSKKRRKKYCTSPLVVLF